MKLFRLAHFHTAYQLRNRPEEGWCYFGAQPYFSVFDSRASAILESYIFKTTGSIPSTFRMVEYEFPVDCKMINLELSVFDGSDGKYLENNFHQAINRYLIEAGELLARVPSPHWRHQYVYIVNPLHFQFSKVHLISVYPCI